MSTPVTQQTIGVTQQAQTAFEGAVNALGQIYSQVIESNSVLSTAMVSDTGTKFYQAVLAWTDEFNDIKNTLQWMADQLGNTWQKMLANEQHNTDLAAGLQAMVLPSSF